jgi:hypothetical protein
LEVLFKETETLNKPVLGIRVVLLPLDQAGAQAATMSWIFLFGVKL